MEENMEKNTKHDRTVSHIETMFKNNEFGEIVNIDKLIIVYFSHFSKPQFNQQDGRVTGK